MRILVTNDDGIEAEGLHVLAEHIAELGHETLVAAPDRDQSGTGAALGVVRADDHIEARDVTLPGCPDVRAYSVAGTPGLCVIAARLGAFGPAPDVIVSGINLGNNIGRSILHSGTVGAALTAQNFGGKGLAVSVESVEPYQWHTAAEVAGSVLELLLDAPPRTVLNVNVPARPSAEIEGIRWARLDSFGSVRSSLAETEDGRLQMAFVGTTHDPAPGSDRALLADGYATVTSVVGVAEAWPDPGVEVPEIVEQTVPGAPVERVTGLERSRLTLRLHGD